jgi:hypothetical protein
VCLSNSIGYSPRADLLDLLYENGLMPLVRAFSSESLHL